MDQFDAVWMGQIHHFLGLSVSCVQHQSSFVYDPSFSGEGEKDKERGSEGSFKVEESYLKPVERKEAYQTAIDKIKDELKFTMNKEAVLAIDMNIPDKVQKTANKFGNKQRIKPALDRMKMQKAMEKAKKSRQPGKPMKPAKKPAKKNG